MPRVSQETIKKLNSFINSLPVETRKKCALCSETLTHICKMAEVQTGAGTATVSRIIADKINENAAPGDRVSSVALRDRVRRNEGIIAKHYNNQEQEQRQQPIFNATNDNIEWAKWTWNPVTGCKHNCPYCYARDIANRFYKEGFEPTYHPYRLSAPQNTKIPEHRKNETGIKNVFVCSMADLFGEWVPAEWIKNILHCCAENQQWNFIFLTKNPKRYLEFNLPTNCWIGATADTQARMNEAIRVFKIFDFIEDGSGEYPWILNVPQYKFISCEPLKEEISIIDLIDTDGTGYGDTMSFFAPFDWFIIGGQSKTSGQPEFQPEWHWVSRLNCELERLGVQIYWKPNLTVRPKEYPSGAIVN